MLRVIDLFAGACGGWSLGLHRAGFTTVAAVEVDEWRRGRFARNFPDARLYGDIRELAGERVVRELGYSPEVIVGSPPCQDASIARRGARTGIRGERTGLFREFVRLVRELRPRWVCAENVTGLVGAGAERIAGDLEQAGYRPWIFNMGAEDFGAPHERRRLWYVAVADADKARLENAWRQPRPSRADRPGAAFGSMQAQGNPWRQGEGHAVRMAAGFPRDVPSGRIIAAYGDAIVPHIAEAIGRAIRAAEGVMP